MIDPNVLRRMHDKGKANWSLEERVYSLEAYNLYNLWVAAKEECIDTYSEDKEFVCEYSKVPTNVLYHLPEYKYIRVCADVFEQVRRYGKELDFKEEK